MAGVDDWEQAKLALESLCREYWKPLHAFTRRLGQTEADASDTIQEFLSRFVESGGFTKANEPKGRLRTFLLSSLRNFITDQWRHSQIKKNLVQKGALPLDAWKGNESSEDANQTLAGTEAFDREWAKSIMDRTLDSLRKSYAERGKQALFDKLLPVVEGDNLSSKKREYLCTELGLSSNAMGVEIHRLRNRLAQTIRKIIGDTVNDESEIEEELRYLAKVLAK